MYTNLKEAWATVVEADDLDNHLENLGQAVVNAKTVEEMLMDYPLSKNSKIIMPGCGTGQIFDYISSTIFLHNIIYFTDINQSFLDKLNNRLKKHPTLHYTSIIDDIECSKIEESFNGVVAVLLLEQLNWQKAVDNMVKYNPENIYLIIQEQEITNSSITINSRTPSSILEFSKVAEPQLVSKWELENYLKNHNFNLRRVYKNIVPNNKTMVGLVFCKNNTI